DLPGLGFCMGFGGGVERHLVRKRSDLGFAKKGELQLAMQEEIGGIENERITSTFRIALVRGRPSMKCPIQFRSIGPGNSRGQTASYDRFGKKMRVHPLQTVLGINLQPQLGSAA